MFPKASICSSAFPRDPQLNLGLVVQKAAYNQEILWFNTECGWLIGAVYLPKTQRPILQKLKLWHCKDRSWKPEWASKWEKFARIHVWPRFYDLSLKCQNVFFKSPSNASWLSLTDGRKQESTLKLKKCNHLLNLLKFAHTFPTQGIQRITKHEILPLSKGRMHKNGQLYSASCIVRRKNYTTFFSYYTE